MAHGTYAVHDPGGEHLIIEAGRTGWIVTTHELGTDEHPRGYDFTRHHYGGRIKTIARLNHRYGKENGGTIPAPDKFQAFAQTCARFVANSPGCERVIIGNEIGIEFGGSLRDYVRCYVLCADAIKSAAPQVEVMPQAPAPWNPNPQYPENQRGDWVKQLTDQLQWAGLANVDGIAIHAYSHGASPATITDPVKMNPPFEDRHYQFPVYRDFMHAIPPEFRHLPVYITEADQNDPWLDQETGWVQAAYAEIDAWNRQGAQQIHCLALYRWPEHDQWSFCNKAGVQNDFRQALQHGYEVRSRSTPTGKTAYVTATVGLNVRVEPFNGAVAVVAPYGAALKVLDDTRQEWWQVEYQGVSGWSSVSYLSTTQPPAPESPHSDQGKWDRSIEFVKRWEGGYTDGWHRIR